MPIERHRSLAATLRVIRPADLLNGATNDCEIACSLGGPVLVPIRSRRFMLKDIAQLVAMLPLQESRGKRPRGRLRLREIAPDTHSRVGLVNSHIDSRTARITLTVR